MNAPKYGNDDIKVDDILARWENWFTKMCKNYESLYAKPYYSCQISVSTHGAMGAATIASPDGRLSGTTFADGSMSAYPGTDRNGPYALMTSATVWDHSKSPKAELDTLNGASDHMVSELGLTVLQKVTLEICC